MKKVIMIMAAVAAVAMVSCQKPNNTNLDNVVLDGFYVVGDATGSANIQAAYMMSAGVNEVDKKAREGMYEKYVALAANKEFTLAFYESGKVTKYGAVLSEVNTNGENDQPTVTIYKGKLLEGDAAKAMKVTKDGLYHIVLDLNKANDLSAAQIILAPVSWGVRGINGDWSWKEMTASAFDMKKMTWTIHFDNINAGDFKFAYGGGWKIQLDDAGNVKAETNLGEDMKPGGGNIGVLKADGVDITLTWNLAAGEIAKSYVYEFKATKVYAIDPKTEAGFTVGFSGTVNGWGDPADGFAAVLNASESKVTDATSFAGTYVYDLASITLTAEDLLKVRVNGAWIGYSDVTIEGLKAEEAATDGNIAVKEAGTFSVKISFSWNGGAASKIKLVFTKK